MSAFGLFCRRKERRTLFVAVDFSVVPNQRRYLNSRDLSTKKALQTCKPDSVLVAESLPFIWADASRRGSALPTPLAGSCRSRCASHTSSAEAKRKVYMAFQPARFIRPPTCVGAPCALTARFHPYRGHRPAAVIFCDPLCASAVAETPPVRWCGALCCPDFPPRPLGQRRQSGLQCIFLLANEHYPSDASRAQWVGTIFRFLAGLLS